MPGKFLMTFLLIILLVFGVFYLVRKQSFSFTTQSSNQVHTIREKFEAPSYYYSGAIAKKGGIFIDRTEKDEIWSLFAGFKDVCWVGPDLEILKGYIREYGKQYPRVRCAVIENPGFPGSYIVYSLPQGEKYALLFAKQTMEKIGNSYLIGHLLGYADEDIEYYFGDDYSIELERNVEYFEAKDAAEKYIKSNSETIQQWAQDNDIQVIYSWPED